MDKLLTPNEMAERLGVKPSTIYRWTHEGFIPYVKMGRFVRFKTKDIEKWVDERATDGRKTRRVDVRGLGV
jgi:excisionase family DNA binding protein